MWRLGAGVVGILFTALVGVVIKFLADIAASIHTLNRNMDVALTKLGFFDQEIEEVKDRVSAVEKDLRYVPRFDH